MDQPIIEIQTKNDYETLKEFYRFFIFSGKGRRGGQRFAFIMAVFVMFAALFSWIFTKDSMFLIFGGVMLIVVILFAVMYYITPKLVFKRAQKVMAENLLYRFFDDHIEVEARGENTKSSESVNYSVFTMVYDVKNAFYLKLTSGVTYIIRKQDMEEAQTAALGEFLKHKFTERFKIYD